MTSPVMLEKAFAGFDHGFGHHPGVGLSDGKLIFKGVRSGGQELDRVDVARHEIYDTLN